MHQRKMSEKQILSFYIPYVPEDFGWWAPHPKEEDRPAYYVVGHSTAFEACSRERFTELFESYLNMGKLKRIDFTNRTHPKTGRKITSAFVHFESIKNTPFTQGVHECIKKNGKTMLYGVPREDRYLREVEESSSQFNKWCELSTPHLWFISSAKKPLHLILCENISPIPEAVNCELNVHQLVAMNATLEFKLAEKDKKICELETLLFEKLQQSECSAVSSPSPTLRPEFMEPPSPPKLKREGSALYCFPPLDLEADVKDLPPIKGEAVLHYDGKPVSLSKSLF